MDSHGSEVKKVLQPIGHLRNKGAAVPSAPCRPLDFLRNGASGSDPLSRSNLGLLGRSWDQAPLPSEPVEESRGQMACEEEPYDRRANDGSLGLQHLPLSLSRELGLENIQNQGRDPLVNYPCWVKPDACECFDTKVDYWRILQSKEEQAYRTSQILAQRGSANICDVRRDLFSFRNSPGTYGINQRPGPLAYVPQSNIHFEECFYCKAKGKDKAMYRSHSMRSPCSKEIICPLLTAKMCLICGDNGGFDVHSEEECTNPLRKLSAGGRF